LPDCDRLRVGNCTAEAQRALRKLFLIKKEFRLCELSVSAVNKEFGYLTADQPKADQPQFSRLRRGGRGEKSFWIKKYSELRVLRVSV
jgi:hypothetical protein